MSKKTLEQLKMVIYNTPLELVSDLLRARLALSIHAKTKTARLQIDSVFPEELIPLLEEDLQCKIKVNYRFWSTDVQPHATLFTVKL